MDPSGPNDLLAARGNEALLRVLNSPGMAALGTSQVNDSFAATGLGSLRHAGVVTPLAPLVLDHPALRWL